jgi:hypothetical protein
MNTNTLFRLVLTLIILVIVPGMASAKGSVEINSDLPAMSMEILADSTIKKQPVKPDEVKPDDKKPGVKKVDIKEIPRAKRQIKPVAVKTRVKIPVKRVKPTIRRPLGLIKRNLGI